MTDSQPAALTSEPESAPPPPRARAHPRLTLFGAVAWLIGVGVSSAIGSDTAHVNFLATLVPPLTAALAPLCWAASADPAPLLAAGTHRRAQPLRTTGLVVFAVAASPFLGAAAQMMVMTAIVSVWSIDGLRLIAPLADGLPLLQSDTLLMLAAGVTLAGMLLPLRQMHERRAVLPWITAAGAMLAFATTHAPPAAVCVGLAWLWVGIASRTQVSDAPGPQRVRQSAGELKHLLVTRNTVFTAGGMLLVLLLAMDWRVAAVFVLLLYGHELGHVLFAVARCVHITHAPLFIPGLGAFVRTAPRTEPVDDLWVSLGGPVLGGSLALGCKIVGASLGLDWLSEAGELGLLVNLVNLAPIGPLDGGRLAALTGPIGSLCGLAIAFVVLRSALSPVLFVCFVAGIVLTARSFRTQAAVPGWGVRIGAVCACVVTYITLQLGEAWTGRVSRAIAPRADVLGTIEYVAVTVLALWLASNVVIAYAWQPSRSAATRYLLITVFGWWSYLPSDARWVPLMFQGALAALFPSAGLARLERSVQNLAKRGEARAGGAAAIGYDVIARSRGGHNREVAEAWLANQLAVLEASRCEEVMASLWTSLERLGHSREQHPTDGVPLSTQPLRNPAVDTDHAA